MSCQTFTKKKSRYCIYIFYDFISSLISSFNLFLPFSGWKLTAVPNIINNKKKHSVYFFNYCFFFLSQKYFFSIFSSAKIFSFINRFFPTKTIRQLLTFSDFNPKTFEYILCNFMILINWYKLFGWDIFWCLFVLSNDNEDKKKVLFASQPFFKRKNMV